MTWNYKNTEIFINEDGKFYANGNAYNTFDEAKASIDKLNSLYYNFTKDDCNNMKANLSVREQEMLSQMAKAILCPGMPVSEDTPTFAVDLNNFIIGDIPMYEELV